MANALAIMKLLLAHGAPVNAINNEGNTPLADAVRKCRAPNFEDIQLLIESGADINIKNNAFGSQYSPLDYAVMHNRQCAQFLIKTFLLQNFETNINLIDLEHYQEYRYSELRGYFHRCVAEIVQMKTDGIANIVLFNIMTKKRQLYLLDDFVLINDWLQNLPTKYPIYNDVISEKVKYCIERSKLFKKLSDIQVFTILKGEKCPNEYRKVVLNHYCLCEICEYLSIKDLDNFVSAFSLLTVDQNLHSENVVKQKPGNSNTAEISEPLKKCPKL